VTFSGYTSALDALDVLIAAGDWAGAREQIPLCRTQLLRLPDITIEGGNSLKLRSDQLDALEKTIFQKLAASQDRFLLTRTNYDSP